jgi:hypothetical protein
VFSGFPVIPVSPSLLLPPTQEVQDDRKVTQPIPDTCSICQKKIPLKSEEKKMENKVSEMSTVLKDACIVFTVFVMRDATR